jgi:hypothetical protein
MSQAVEQRGRHLCAAKHARTFAEGKIGGDDDGRSLAAVSHNSER